jgi:hypothetical protein
MLNLAKQFNSNNSSQTNGDTHCFSEALSNVTKFSPQISTNGLNLNSKALKQCVEAADDRELGLVLVLTIFTSPGYMDVKFRSSEGGNAAPIVLGCTSAGDCTRWLRGYPVEMAFDGEICTNEGEEVFILWMRT